MRVYKSYKGVADPVKNSTKCTRNIVCHLELHPSLDAC
jgi:hypothetical protein